MGKLADAFVEIRGQDAPLNKTLDTVHRNLLGLGKVGARAGTTIGHGLRVGIGLGMGGLGLAVIGQQVMKAVHGASDLNETTSKVGVIFGKQSQTITAAADEMARKFGTVRTEFMDTAATIGQLLQGMGGQTQASAAKMSVELAKMADDAGSIFNKTFGEAAGKIESALRGESEPISAFGVDVQELAVKQEAMRTGIAGASKELTTQQKVAARSSLILRQLRIATGDHEATLGGYANAMRAVHGRIQNLLDTVGMVLNPVIEKYLGAINKMIQGTDEWVSNNKGTLAKWVRDVETTINEVIGVFQHLGEGFTATGQRLSEEVNRWTGLTTDVGTKWYEFKAIAKDVFDGIGIIFRNWGLIGEMVGVRVLERYINIGEGLQWLMGVAKTFGEYLSNNWVSMIRDAVNGAWTILSNFGDNVKELMKAIASYFSGTGFAPNYKPLLDGFKAMSEKLPEIARPAFTKLTAEFDRISKQINENEIVRAQRKIAGEDVPMVKARPGAAKRDEETKTAEKAKHFDPVSFQKHIQEGLMGKNKLAERTAKASESISQTANRIEAAMRKVKAPEPGFAT